MQPQQWRGTPGDGSSRAGRGPSDISLDTSPKKKLRVLRSYFLGWASCVGERCLWSGHGPAPRAASRGLSPGLSTLATGRPQARRVLEFVSTWDIRQDTLRSGP